jgi:hypothetical protein
MRRISAPTAGRLRSSITIPGYPIRNWEIRVSLNAVRRRLSNQDCGGD